MTLNRLLGMSCYHALDRLALTARERIPLAGERKAGPGLIWQTWQRGELNAEMRMPTL